MKTSKTLRIAIAAAVALLIWIGAAHGAGTQVKPTKPSAKTSSASAKQKAKVTPRAVTPKTQVAQTPSALFPAYDDLRWGYIDKTSKAVMSGYEETGDFSDGLAPVKINGRYGFMDTAGKVVVPATYDGAGRYSEGLAPVRVEKLWGYADKAGSVVIKPRYDEALEFSEGLAVVKSGDKYGAIDKNGAFAIQPGYQQMLTASDGLIAVMQDGRWGFIDAKGAAVIPAQFSGAGSFSGGLAPASSGGKWGFIDKTGRWVVEPKYAAADPFSEGLASVGTMARDMLKDDEGRVMKIVDYIIRGYIDSTGREVIPLEFRSAGAFSEGLAPVRKNDDFGFIDKTGAILISSPFGQDTGSFHNGLAKTNIGPRYGYINEAGKMVIPQQFADAANFSEGLAAVRIHHWYSYGYVDMAGRMAIKPRFMTAFSFSKGLARVRGDLKWGIIDKAGKYALDQQFGDIGWITDKVIAARPAVGKTKSLWGFYDRSGQAILEPQFESASFLGDTQAVVKKGNKYGVVDGAGRLVVPTEYDDAGWLFAEGLLPVSKGGKFGFIDAAGKSVIEPKYDAVSGFTPAGLCAVKVADKWGFIDHSDKMVIPPQYDSAVGFSEDRAAVKVAGLWGVIDKTGKLVIQPRYSLAGSFNCGLATVLVGDKWGYIDKAGKLAIPAQFDKALDFDNNLAQVRLGNQTGYINTTGKTVWMSRQYPSASAQGPAPSQAAVQITGDGVRIVKVKVAADQIVQQRGDWRESLRKRMQAVSDLMEKSFKIRLDFVELPWITPGFKDSDDPNKYGDGIFDKLTKDVPLEDAEIIIGFTGRASRSTTLAFTRFYFNWVIVYDPYNGAQDREEEIVSTVAHEMCHQFGAFHVIEKTSIMNALVYRDIPQTTFDPYSTRQMSLMHDYDFAKRLDSLSKDKIKSAATIHGEGHAPQVPFPVAWAYMYRGVSRSKDGDTAGAVRDYCRALEFDGREPDFVPVYKLGKVLMDDGQLVLGIETLRRCPSLKTDPDHAARYHNYLGDDLAELLRRDTTFIERRETAKPKLGEIYQRYVLTKISPDDVISEYREAIKASPKDASYHSKLGQALLDHGRLDESLAAYQQAIALEPDNTYYQSRIAIVKARIAAESPVSQ